MKNFILQVVPIIYPISTSNEPMTEEGVKGLIGMFILMNILYLISLIICHVIYFKEKIEHKKSIENSRYKYPFSHSYFSFIFVDGANLMFCEIINWFAGITNIAVIFICLGILIGKMF